MPLIGLETVERTDPVYKTCLAASTAGGAVLGAATGSVIPLAGTIGGYLAGAAWGFAAGYVACPYLSPMIKRKFELGQALTETDLATAAHAMGTYAKVTHAQDALHLVSIVKKEIVRTGTAPECLDPAIVAKKLLKSV